MWTSKRSTAWSRKSSRQLRRSINVMPSAVRRSSSTDRTSEPFCSRWLLRCACSLSSSSRLDAVCGAVKEVDRRPEQVLEIGFEPRVVQRGDEGVEDVGDGASDRLAFGQRPRIGLVVEGTVAKELQFVEDVIGGR